MSASQIACIVMSYFFILILGVTIDEHDKDEESNWHAMSYLIIAIILAIVGHMK